MHIGTTYLKQAGSALLEVIVGAIILSVGILGALQVTAEAARYEKSAQLMERAVICAQSQLENIRTKTYSEISGSSPSLISGSLCESALTPTATVITPTPSSDGYRIITVAVTWQNRHNNAQSISLSTIIADTSAADSGETLMP